MKTIRQLLENRETKIVTVSPDVTVFKAVQRMAEKSIGTLLVTEQGHVVGIFSKRDYAQKLTLNSRDSEDTMVREVMNTRVTYAWMEQTVAECISKMTELHIRHMPVVDGGRLIGIVSMSDLVKAIIDEQQYKIDQLEQYICS